MLLLLLLLLLLGSLSVGWKLWVRAWLLTVLAMTSRIDNRVGGANRAPIHDEEPSLMAAMSFFH